MAYDFNGTTFNIGMGSDASIDDFAAITFAYHTRWDGAGGLDIMLDKSNASNLNGYLVQFRNTNVPAMRRDFSGGPSTWAGSSNVSGSHHIVQSHDGNLANDSRIVVDGTVNSVSQLEAPSGTLDADAGNNLTVGNIAAGGASGFDGALQNLCIANAVWTAAEENRHRWWGCAPGGPSTVEVWCPMYTDAVNRGTATLTPSVTGATITSLPRPTVRPGMGMGW